MNKEIEQITGKILEKYYKPKTKAEEEDFVACGTELMIVIDKYWKKKINEPAFKHGKSNDKVYITWTNMKIRCFDPNFRLYKNYGERGITVCDRWKDSFINFYNDMGDKPEGKTLDRIDNDGNYEPNNCRWITHKEQCNNKSNNIRFTYNGKSKTIAQWSQELSVPYNTLKRRVRNGLGKEYIEDIIIKKKIEKALDDLKNRIDDRIGKDLPPSHFQKKAISEMLNDSFLIEKIKNNLKE